MENNNKIVGFGDYKNYYTFDFQVLGVTQGYSCIGCGNCFTGYYLNGSTCIKNTTITPTNNTTKNIT